MEKHEVKIRNAFRLILILSLWWFWYDLKQEMPNTGGMENNMSRISDEVHALRQDVVDLQNSLAGR